MKNKKIIVCGVVCFVLGALSGILGTNLFMHTSKDTSTKKKSDVVEMKKSEIAENVTLGDYKGITVSLVPTEEDIQSDIDSTLEEYTNYEQLTGTATDGDMVYAEYEGDINGEPVDELTGSDYVEIGANEWPDGFEEAFIGLKTGKTNKTSIKIPDGYFGNDDVDGATVKLKVKLIYICGEAILPEYNDEFVQSISKYNTVAEYNNYIKEKLVKENEDEKDEYVWSEVLENSTIKKYPENLMESARKEVLQGYYDMAELYGQTPDEIFKSFGNDDEEDFKKNQLDELAKDTVKEIMVANAIANKEKISYTKKEYKDLVQSEYENNADSYKDKEEYEKKNENYLKNTALINAVKTWITKNVTFETK